jgi:two-component system sensor histidine kinase KdpD
VIFTSGICYQFTGYLGYQSVSFILLFVVSILATFMGIGPILLAASLSVFVWNFFFIPPKFTIHIEKTEDVLMFFMFFIIALVNGVLTSRVRRQEKLTRDREERTNALYQLTKQIANADSMDTLIGIAVKDIKKHFGLDTVFILQDGYNHLSEYKTKSGPVLMTPNEMSVAEWVFRHSRKAGRFTDTLPSNNFTFYPLAGNRIKSGVIAIKHQGPLPADWEELWDTFLTQISNAIEREFLDDIAKRALILDESDKLYKSLFNSISHELRIPVATIMGVSDALVSGIYDKETSMRLYGEINKASERLNRLIDNLLNMSRLETGRITPKRDWHDVHDLANKVIGVLKNELQVFKLEISMPDDMPLVKIDFGLMENVLHNLVLNATQYSKPGTTIRIKMYYDNQNLIMQVMDRGPGFPRDELQNVFNKFYRLEGSISGGTGLGLSIVKGFVQAQNGDVKIENRKNGGSTVTVKIPSEIADLNKILS